MGELIVNKDKGTLDKKDLAVTQKRETMVQN